MSTSNTSGMRRNRRAPAPRSGPRRRRQGPQQPASFLDRPMTLRQVGRASNQAYQMARQALSLANAEKKHFDTAVSEAPGNTPSLTCLNLIAEGDTDVTRNGLSVRFKGLYLQLNINLNSTAPAFDIFRVVMFRHYMPAAVSPTNALVMATSAINSFTNYHARALYEILYDRSYNLSPGAAVSITDSFNIKLDDVTRWNGAGATAADLDNNGYWIMTWGVENTNKSQVGWQTRMTYYDN